jgi:preprotein translocase subunit SecA
VTIVIAGFADTVLQKAAAFSHLHRGEQIRAELDKLRSREPARETIAPEDLHLVVRRLAPPELDELSAERMGLACRVAELVLGQTARHHQIVCAALVTQGRIVEMPNGVCKTLAAALAAALTASRG